jgi:hypothetical protein
MGSIHFIDFVMFHRYLGIKDMLSVELSHDIVDRVRFNAPYQQLITTKVGVPVGDFLSSFDQRAKYLIWLDYDNVLSVDMLRDLSLACTTLPPHSIILVTVDTEPPVKGHCRDEDTQENLEKSYQYFKEVAGHIVYPFPRIEDFAYLSLARRNVEFLSASITGAFRHREFHFQPLFNFIYADGHRMLTIGGMVVDSKARRLLRKSRILSENYVRTTLEEDPFVIRVPVLTRREQLYLDSNMPSPDGWTPREFELREEDIQDYRKIYRFFPSYAEVLL